MRAAVLWILGGIAAMSGAQAQQLRKPELPNRFKQLQVTTSPCQGPRGGVTVSVSGSVSLPGTAADTAVSFEVVEGTLVRASGEAPVARVRTPRGEATPTVAIRTAFDLPGLSGKGKLRVRIGGSAPSESATASYSWNCLTAVREVVPAQVPLPDLTFDTRVIELRMARDRRDPADQGNYATNLTDAIGLIPGQRFNLWDPVMCRKLMTSWSFANFTVYLANAGPGLAPEFFEIEVRVPFAPEWPAENAAPWPHSRLASIVLKGPLPVARAATGRQETVYFARTESRYWLKPGAATAYGRIDTVLPCGHGRRLEIILDPDDKIKESDETNNRLVFTYDLVG